MSTWDTLRDRAAEWARSPFVWIALVTIVVVNVSHALRTPLMPGPPWPSPVPAALIVAAGSMVGLVSGRVLLHGLEVRFDKMAIGAGVALLSVTAVVYIYFESEYVVDVDDPTDRRVMGTEFLPNIRLLVDAAPEQRTPRQLFIDFHDAESIWVSAGVRRNRRVLFGTWVLANVSLAFLLGVWDVHRTRSKSDSGPLQGRGEG